MHMLIIKKLVSGSMFVLALAALPGIAAADLDAAKNEVAVESIAAKVPRGAPGPRGYTPPIGSNKGSLTAAGSTTRPAWDGVVVDSGDDAHGDDDVTGLAEE